MIFQQIWFLIYSLKFNKKTLIHVNKVRKHTYIHRNTETHTDTKRSAQAHRDTQIGIF